MAQGPGVTAASFLAAQLRDGKAVTARLLSRALGIHLDQARAALAVYAEENAEETCATYLVCGCLRPESNLASGLEASSSWASESQLAGSSSTPDSQDRLLQRRETVERTVMHLVLAEQLQALRANFDGEPTTQLYSLSASVKKRATAPKAHDGSAASLDPTIVTQLTSLGVQVRELGLANARSELGSVGLEGASESEYKPPQNGLSGPSQPTAQKSPAPTSTAIKKELKEPTGSKNAAGGKSSGSLSWDKAKPPAAQPARASKKRKSLLPDSEEEEDDDDEGGGADEFDADADAAMQDVEGGKIGYSIDQEGDTEMTSGDQQSSKAAASVARQASAQKAGSLRKKKEGGRRVRKQRTVVRKIKTKNAKGYTEMKEEQGYESYSTLESEPDEDAEAPVSHNASAQAVDKTSRARDIGSGSSIRPQVQERDVRDASGNHAKEVSASTKEKPDRPSAPAASSATNTAQGGAASSGNAKKKAGQQKLSAFFNKPK